MEINAWYAAYAQYAKAKQFISAQDDGKLHADKTVTRGEFAELMYRIMYTKEQNLQVFPISLNWPAYKNGFGHYSAKYPFNWIKVEAGNNIIFWKQDTLNKQVSFAKVYPEGATLILSVDLNTEKVLLNDYMAGVKYDANADIKSSTLNGYDLTTVILNGGSNIDFYLQLPNKAIVIGYSQVGDGLSRTQLIDQIRYIIGSVVYDETIQNNQVTDKDQFLSGVRGKILLKGKGGEAIGMFRDLLLFETDTIGIGTGPVDYYYSKEYDVSLKYERTSKTLLSINEGKTSAF